MNQYRYTNDVNRRSGRTTMEALHVVHLILDNPYVEVFIEDHAPVHAADVMLFDLVVSVLRALRVDKHCRINRSRLSISCDGPPQPYIYPTAAECLQRQEEHLIERRKNSGKVRPYYF